MKKLIILLLMVFVFGCSEDNKELDDSYLEKMAVYREAYQHGFIDATLGYKHSGYDDSKEYDDYEWYAKSYVMRIKEFTDSLKGTK